MDADAHVPGVPVNDEGLMTCPKCGFEYVHPVAVAVDSPGTKKGRVTIDRGGVHQDPSVEHNHRGAGIRLTFQCENGHRFQYEMAFHKGHTQLESQVSDLPDLDPMDDLTIWRD